jgi:hypothetical protein
MTTPFHMTPSLFIPLFFIPITTSPTRSRTLSLFIFPFPLMTLVYVYMISSPSLLGAIQAHIITTMSSMISLLLFS